VSSKDCEHCGSNKYFAREFPRVRDEAQFWQQKAKTLAAEVEALKLDQEFSAYRDRTDVAWLQGKVVAQARELRRLNDAHNVQRIRSGLDPVPDKSVSSVTKTEVQAGD
jgi:hypothetical protein